MGNTGIRSASGGTEVVGASGFESRPLGDGASVRPRVAVARLGPAGGRVFPRLLASEDGEVHERVAVVHGLDAEHVGWAVVYGISNNPRQFWDLSHGRELLGWFPKDRAPE